MTLTEAHSILEDMQRIMTQYRLLFTDEMIKANGLAILALEEQIKHKVEQKNSDEGIILENLLLRLVALDANPVLPYSNRTFSFLMTDTQRKVLGDCIYKYLGEHYPESASATIQKIVEEEK